jgi:hypothetical protein
VVEAVVEVNTAVAPSGCAEMTQVYETTLPVMEVDSDCELDSVEEDPLIVTVGATTAGVLEQGVVHCHGNTS